MLLFSLNVYYIVEDENAECTALFLSSNVFFIILYAFGLGMAIRELQCHAADVLHEEGWENIDSWQLLPIPNDLGEVGAITQNLLKGISQLFMRTKQRRSLG